MKEKAITYLLLVGYLQTYVHLVKIKAENPDDIIPISGAFHQQCSFIYAIYKRICGSGISEVPVSVGVTVEGLPSKALKEKHYRRQVGWIFLVREAVIHIRIKEILTIPQIQNSQITTYMCCDIYWTAYSENLHLPTNALWGTTLLKVFINQLIWIWEISDCFSLKYLILSFRISMIVNQEAWRIIYYSHVICWSIAWHVAIITMGFSHARLLVHQSFSSNISA